MHPKHLFKVERNQKFKKNKKVLTWWLMWPTGFTVILLQVLNKQKENPENAMKKEKPLYIKHFSSALSACFD